MATESIHKYLQDTNRPYSANDIMANLHNEFGKTVVQKALDQLTESGKVKEKTYGKQKVYCIVQPDTDDNTESDLKELEVQTSNMVENLHLVERDLKSSEAELQELSSTLTTEQAKKKEDELKNTLAKLQVKLKELSENTTPVSPEERDKLIKVREQHVKEYRKRKRMCMNMIDAIMEGYPKTKKLLIDELGLETDEDVNMAPF